MKHAVAIVLAFAAGAACAQAPAYPTKSIRMVIALAHELTHIQDLRQLRGKRLPSFMLEALAIDQAYRLHIWQKPGDYDRQMARSAATFTPEQAMELLENFRGHGWNNQAIGIVVVE